METNKKHVICIHTDKNFPPHMNPNSEHIYYAGMKFGQMQFSEKESCAKKFDKLEDCSFDFVHISNYINDKNFVELPYKPVTIKPINV